MAKNAFDKFSLIQYINSPWTAWYIWAASLIIIFLIFRNYLKFWFMFFISLRG